MANWYFEPGEQRAARVNELFTGIATRYDLLNDLQSLGLHRRWKRRLIALAGAKPGLRALDLCCGTGDLAFALARRGADVAGLDFSQAMLQVAQRKKSKVQSLKSKVQEQESGTRSQESGIGIVSSQWSVVRSKRHEPRTREYGLRTTDHGFGLPRFIRADALRIPFRDNAFDIVTVGYGLRNLANWERGLCEMQRVAKPGGRLLALEFGKPDHPLWRGLYFGYLKLFVPLLGRLFCKNAGAYAYILESLKHFPAQQGVAARMRELGLQNVQIFNLLGGVMSINFAEKEGSGAAVGAGSDGGLV